MLRGRRGHLHTHPPTRAGSVGHLLPVSAWLKAQSRECSQSSSSQLAQMCEDPSQTFARLPEPPEPMGQPAALEAAPGGNAAFLCYWTSLV